MHLISRGVARGEHLGLAVEPEQRAQAPEEPDRRRRPDRPDRRIGQPLIEPPVAQRQEVRQATGAVVIRPPCGPNAIIVALIEEQQAKA